MRLAERLPEHWRARWRRWLDRRMPPASRLALGQRSIFILPTARGAGLLLVVLVLLLVATNYENSLVFALGFWLLGVFLVGILHTYANLHRLQLSAVTPRPVFAGGDAAVELRLGSESGGREGIELGWPGAAEQRCRVPAGGEVAVSLHHPAPARGRLRPGRLRLASCYPLGWFQAWSWPDLDVEVLVYPKPLPGPWPDAAGDAAAPAQRAGGEDFTGYSAYRPGDAPRDVAWRAYARGLPLQTRRYAGTAANASWLRWQDFSPLETEQRLGRMCWWALELARQERPFGLLLPGVELAPASGEAHLSRVLRALAEHGR